MAGRVPVSHCECGPRGGAAEPGSPGPAGFCGLSADAGPPRYLPRMLLCDSCPCSCALVSAPRGPQAQRWTHGGHLGDVLIDGDGQGQAALRAAQASGLCGTRGSRLVTADANTWSHADAKVVVFVWSPDNAWCTWELRDPSQ